MEITVADEHQVEVRSPAEEERRFPDLRRLRLDTLLRELVDRADEVIDHESRVHRLLDAVVNVTSNLSLPDVLYRFVQSACELVGARYGVLGVLGQDQKPAEFIDAGVDQRLRARIGELISEGGVLAELAANPKPLRLHDVRPLFEACVIPPDDPLMRSFLGIPVRVRGEVFGTLYLTEKVGGGDFSEEDQEVVIALTAAGGIAIENARLYEQTHQRELWLQASNEITGALLSGQSTSSVLELIAHRARVVAGAAVAAIALTGDGAEDLALEVVDGPSAKALEGRTVPVTGAMGEVLRSSRPVVLEGPTEPATWLGDVSMERLADVKDLTSVLLVPLAAGEHVLGVLLVAKEQGRPPFTDADGQMVQTFAAQAALTLEFARAQEDRQRLAVFQDRDRIARDLHDLVIQRLFATGLGLAGMARLVVRPEVAERLQGFVNDLDQTIRDIRRSIFSLQEVPEDLGQVSLRGQLLRTAQEAAGPLGFEPRLSFDGPLDTTVPETVRADLLATLREALSNAARHAHARTVRVEVSVDSHGEQLNLRVRDDGRGVDPDAARGSGLVNMTERAARWGGSCTLRSVAGSGAELCWSVPLGAPRAAQR
ncbi:histidine kinase [Gandjariella thermophila]|uniref:Histidine kinase n=2 Tax=Gandjariella thermophila TaxID=1931992 RepID=A0A4D4J250_9PSEU|nr:histidine kinase [Gandjariella thermophila]